MLALFQYSWAEFLVCSNYSCSCQGGPEEGYITAIVQPCDCPKIWHAKNSLHGCLSDIFQKIPRFLGGMGVYSWRLNSVSCLTRKLRGQFAIQIGRFSKKIIDHRIIYSVNITLNNYLLYGSIAELPIVDL